MAKYLLFVTAVCAQMSLVASSSGLCADPRGMAHATLRRVVADAPCGDAAVGWNPIRFDETTSASVASLRGDDVILPPGAYTIEASVPALPYASATLGGDRRLRVRASEDSPTGASTTLYVGVNNLPLIRRAEIDCADGCVIQLQIFSSEAHPSYGLGLADAESGEAGVCAEMRVERTGL